MQKVANPTKPFIPQKQISVTLLPFGAVKKHLVALFGHGEPRQEAIFPVSCPSLI
jgi:hypothetical protein